MSCSKNSIRSQKKTILLFLKAKNLYHDIDVNSITGIDDIVTASLSSWKIFFPFLEKKKLSIDQVEQIINKSSFTEDSRRFAAFLKSNFPALTPDDVKKIATKKFTGFGRLSGKFLTEPVHHDPKTGNKLSIINMMWEYNLNLQQLLSEQFPFLKMVQDAKRKYYSNVTDSLADRLDKMYVSNAVKRPIIRAVTIVDEITKTLGSAPDKIFVEMARDVTDGTKKQRTISRLAQLKAIYQQIADEDVRRLEQELDKYDETALKKNTLYLYFMQLGRDMYTGEPITDLSLYNKEHIYPRSKVKDDSVLNNIVLVRSDINGKKTDTYPIDSSIRNKMLPFWKGLLGKGLITSEKYFRLSRSTPFSDDEEWGFINRQLVETRQSTKVISELLKERYPESEIIYVKAGLVSDFRHEFHMVKSRAINDLHHGKDAYLNIVVGNVYHGYFTRNWFLERPSDYSIKLETLFSSPKFYQSGKMLWQGAAGLGLVRKTMQRNYLHLTNYTYCQKGGFFDQNPISAAPGLIPLKKGMPTELYGGYNKASASFFVFVLTTEKKGKKIVKELTLVPIDLMIKDKFLANEDGRINYIKNFIDPAGKKDLTIEFPLGLKQIKVKTIFEVDNGLRFRLNGKASGGNTLLISLFSPLLLDNKWEQYIKHLESFAEKKKKNQQLIFSERFDKFSAKENVMLYDILLNKLKSTLYAKRPANPEKCLENGRNSFAMLPPEKQAIILLGLISSFGTASGAGIDLTDLDGVPKAGVTTLSSKLSNWKKTFTTACIVCTDSSGLHETKSPNLLELI